MYLNPLNFCILIHVKNTRLHIFFLQKLQYLPFLLGTCFEASFAEVSLLIIREKHMAHFKIVDLIMNYSHLVSISTLQESCQ